MENRGFGGRTDLVLKVWGTGLRFRVLSWSMPEDCWPHYCSEPAGVLSPDGRIFTLGSQKAIYQSSLRKGRIRFYLLNLLGMPFAVCCNKQDHLVAVK
jgi:hypothetical protein